MRGRRAALAAALVLTVAPLAEAFTAPVALAAVPAPLTLISILDTSAFVPATGTDTAIFTVSFSQPSTATVSVLYATHDMSATAAGGDYTPASGVVTFSPGTVSTTIPITIGANPSPPPVKAFTVTLSSPVNANLNNSVAIARLLAPGQPVPIVVSALGASVAEPASGTATLAFQISASSRPTGTTVDVISYATADGTATAANGDYTPVSGVVRFNATLPIVRTVTVTVSHDANAEGTLTFYLAVSTTARAISLVEGAVVGAIVAPGSPPPTPISHVVIIDQENHSFDNVFGVFCTLNARCDGVETGKLPDGTVITLGPAADQVPSIGHSVSQMATAIDGGAMDGFANLTGCAAPKYACLTQFNPSQIPNLIALASSFAISDRTFELNQGPSFGSHLELVAATTDGFTGDNPSGLTTAGWGCDSLLSAPWMSTTGAHAHPPSCVPLPNGMGPFQQSPVKWVPTIMDRLDSAGLSWRIYAAAGGTDLGYSWAICPTFADCDYTTESQNLVPAAQVVDDATAGTLPAVSIVTPVATMSQHNGWKMSVGDSWIGTVLSAIENGPDWASTAVFITYDDCGCFYDHVTPPANLGIRVPMVIVSPYAVPGFTDSNVASYTSLLAYIEHVFTLAPLGVPDETAYDYHLAFNYSQEPNAPVRLTTGPLRWPPTGAAVEDDYAGS